MIQAIAKIGEWYIKSNGRDVTSILTHPINLKKYTNLLILNVLSDDSSVSLHIEEMDQQKNQLLLYRERKGNGANYSPVAALTEWEKTFRVKIMRWFQWVQKERQFLDSKAVSYVKKVQDILLKNRDYIEKEVSKKDINSQEDFVIAVSVDGKFPRKIPEFVRIFKKLIELKEYEIRSKDRVCSICAQLKPVVIAGSSAFNFYTDDKPGFITGGFQKEDSWRNYPVCLQCNLYLQEGRHVLEQKLQFSFSGIPYLLIPEFMFYDEEAQNEVLRRMFEQKKRLALDSKSKDDYLSGEEDILHDLQSSSDQLMLHLLFMRKIHRADRILMLIDDVLPSRLKTLYEKKGEVDNCFADFFPDSSPNSIFHFGRLRPFFFKSDVNKRNADLDGYFLQIVESVFHDKPLEGDFSVSFFMKKLRELLIADSPEFKNMALNAMMSLQYLCVLNLISHKGGDSVEGKLSPYFAKYPYYDTAEKQGLFLLGVLTQQLLKLQQSVRNAQPFKKQLKGYRMTEDDFRSLLSEVYEKFDQYEGTEVFKVYARSRKFLTEEISHLFGLVPKGWKISVDEMNYCFVTGMSMCDQVIDYMKENVFSSKDENEEK